MGENVSVYLVYDKLGFKPQSIYKIKENPDLTKAIARQVIQQARAKAAEYSNID